MTLLDVRVSAGGSFSLELAAGHTCWMYVWRGSGQLGHTEQRPVTAGHVARLSDEGHAFRAEAGRDQGEFRDTEVRGNLGIFSPFLAYKNF